MQRAMAALCPLARVPSLSLRSPNAPVSRSPCGRALRVSRRRVSGGTSPRDGSRARARTNTAMKDWVGKGVWKRGGSPGRRMVCGALDSEGIETDPKVLPDPNTKLYSHSLPGIEEWLRTLGFNQDESNPENWRIERPDWHADLSMDVTELVVRYLKSGPGNLQRDIERKFSYALSRLDVETAIMGGP